MVGTHSNKEKHLFILLERNEINIIFFDNLTLLVILVVTRGSRPCNAAGKEHSREHQRWDSSLKIVYIYLLHANASRRTRVFILWDPGSSGCAMKYEICLFQILLIEKNKITNLYLKILRYVLLIIKRRGGYEMHSLSLVFI